MAELDYSKVVLSPGSATLHPGYLLALTHHLSEVPGEFDGSGRFRVLGLDLGDQLFVFWLAFLGSLQYQ